MTRLEKCWGIYTGKGLARKQPEPRGCFVEPPFCAYKTLLKNQQFGYVRKIPENIHEKNRCLFPFSVANNSSNFPRDASNLLSCGRTRNSRTNYLATNILFVFYLLLKKSSKGSAKFFCIKVTSGHLTRSLACQDIYVFVKSPQYHVPLNPLNAELNPICHLLALLGGTTIAVLSRLRVKFTLRYLVKKLKIASCVEIKFIPTTLILIKQAALKFLHNKTKQMH